MKLKHWLMGGTMMLATAPVGGVLSAAQADVYHAVEPGETLVSIASHYNTRIEVLRAANKLSGTRDDVALPSMLLRVPDGDKNKPATVSSVPTGANRSAINAGGAVTNSNAIAKPLLSPQPSVQSSGSGTVAKAVRYQVQAGDTFESIAARYAQAGYAVTAETLRRKNNVGEQPVAGAMLIVPVSSVSFGNDNAQAARSGAGGPASFDLPVAEMMPQRQPSFNPAFNQLPAPRPQAQRRGPSVLSSRSYSPSTDGARVLQQNEEAINSAAPPQSRSRIIQPSVQTSSKLAQVAQIAKVGARIRRLPQSDAVTLYSCPTGTELAVMRQNGMWSAILMSDRSTGWIPTRYLKFTGASVDITTQVAASPDYSPQKSYSSSPGNYNTDNPTVRQALAWLGTPYVYGGESHRGIDCSSLVQQSFAACGYRLPRTAAEQARVGQPVDPANLQSGDRLYFSASGRRVDHTGLYMGNGLFVHASGSGRRVMVSNLFERRNWNIFVAARR